MIVTWPQTRMLVLVQMIKLDQITEDLIFPHTDIIIDSSLITFMSVLLCVLENALFRGAFCHLRWPDPCTSPIITPPVTERQCLGRVKGFQQFQTFNMNRTPWIKKNPSSLNLSSTASISAICHFVLHFIHLHVKQEASLICKTKG